MEEWIQSEYNLMIKIFKIKKPIPLTIKDINHFGHVASRWYITRKITHRKNPLYTKPKTSGRHDYAIVMSRNFLETVYEDEKLLDDLLSPVIRTLIHEITHYLIGSAKHSKKFYRKYRKLCVKYCSYVLNIREKDVYMNKELINYIDRFRLY